MVDRCYRFEDKDYQRYGALGVKVCERWRTDFLTFAKEILAEIGKRPSLSHGLDRWPNRHGDYEPGNLRWATPREQANNRRDNRLLTAKGKTQTIAEWARETGISKQTILNRVYRNWDDERAVSCAPRRKAPDNSILPRGAFRFCRERGIDATTVASRMRRGLSFEEALAS